MMMAAWLAAQVILSAEGGVPRRVLIHPDEFHGPAQLGTYVSSTWGFSTSSYWIEGPDGLVVVDTQFLPSAAEELIRWAEAATGKKVKLAVVLHANPDKFNGTAVFQARGIRVVTSEQVRALIPAVHEKRLRAFYSRYEPDYPREVTLPESFGPATTELTAAGLTLKLHVMGAGCSEAHVAVEWNTQVEGENQRHLFVGDLVASGSHSWLEIGRTTEWLTRLEELQALSPDFIHPGRGPSGDARLLTVEKGYLHAVMEAVAAQRPRGAPNDKALAAARERIEQRYSGYRFAVFLGIGLPAEWRRQAALEKRPARSRAQ